MLLPKALYDDHYLPATLSGDRSYFDPEWIETHPSFEGSLSLCDLQELGRLKNYLQEELLGSERLLNRARNEVAWKKNSWDRAEAKRHEHYLHCLTRRDRLQHLLTEAQAAFESQRADEESESATNSVEMSIFLKVQKAIKKGSFQPEA